MTNTYDIGPLTMAAVFAPAGLENVSDWQAVLNAVESALKAQEVPWAPIDTAPNNARVIVSGWQPKSGRVAGYWWTEEDNIIDGKPFSHPTATLWKPWPLAPAGWSRT